MSSRADSVSTETELLGKRPVIDTEELIERIQDKPELWDSRHPLFKSKPAATLAWEEVKLAFPTARIYDLKRKWKNLKDSFRKEHRKRSEVLLSLEYPGINPDSTWRHYNSLEFLKEDEAYAASLNAPGRGKFQEDMKDSSCDEGEVMEFQDKTPQLKTYSRTNTIRGSPVPSPQAQTLEPQANNGIKRPNAIRAEFLEIEKKKLKLLEQEIEKQKKEERNEKSEDYHFLMSILPQMEKLHPTQKLRIRNKINQALLEELTVVKTEPQEASIDLPQTYNEPQNPFTDLKNDTECVDYKVEIEDNFF
ncbi:uncharacterized protein LOC126374992 [Pectinophora gossypiella]|nr:uncharacterized protein LOC126374992 [Pectinophora gossypiella]